MKAFLLAAGKGTRLDPLTRTLPKCLVPISGVPLLEIWLRLLEKAGVRDVLINLHHLADRVERFLADRRSGSGMRIVAVREKTLLGSGGTVWVNREFVAAEEDFLIAYADNLTNVDLGDMMAFHRKCRKTGTVLTMGLFHAPDPRSCGIAELDAGGRIVRFVEKPEHPVSDLANAGIYIAAAELYDYFPRSPSGAEGTGVLDLGHDVLPRLAGRMCGYEIRGYIRDIGTIESYRAAQKEWPKERQEGLSMDMQVFTHRYITRLKSILDAFDHDGFEKIVALILEAYEHGRHIFVMGNGGSGATASHLACDINKGCCFDLEKKFKMICLNDNMPTILALANDVSYEAVFVEQLKNFFLPGDLVIGISGSGNSENVLRAIRYARENEGRTIGLSGFSGGKLARLAEVPFIAAVDDMQQVEDIHMVVVHMIMQGVYGALHGGGAGTSPPSTPVCAGRGG
ncbi:MAG: sugar phosphate nucleotidyltransferase [Thermodesulfobacteriota bacterium]